VVFLLVDVTLLQNIGTYSHRWYDIGGGSNWWYHPVWWMVGTFLPWMGAWILANQTVQEGHPSPLVAFLTAAGAAVVCAVVAVLIGFPGAGWTMATFAIAFLPGLVLATALSAVRKRHA
jgi:Flp pilus assembly protein TadB